MIEIELALKRTALLGFLAKKCSSTIISQILRGCSLQSVLRVAFEGGSLSGSSFHQAFEVLGAAHRYLNSFKHLNTHFRWTVIPILQLRKPRYKDISYLKVSQPISSGAC